MKYEKNKKVIKDKYKPVNKKTSAVMKNTIKIPKKKYGYKAS